MSIYSSEFFYCHDRFNDGNKNHDFSDNSLMTTEQRIEFLKEYADHLEKSYPVKNNTKKVFSEEEAKAELDALCEDEALPTVSRRINFSTMRAFLQKVPTERGWYLYTPRTVIEEDMLVFKKHPYPPSPAAVYNIDGDLKEFTFSVYIDSEFKSFISSVIDSTTSRVIELRRGIDDIVKLNFYPHGKFYALLGNENQYILNKQYICDYEYDCWQTVTVKLNGDSFEVSLNGTTKEFACTNALNPDTLFVGSGMFHVGQWQFKPLSMKLDGGEITSFFEGGVSDAGEIEEIGEVKLPFRIGGYENRNKAIILEGEFDYSECKAAVLNLDSLDPHGTVYINGTQVLKTDGFEAQKLDITSYLKEGGNSIKIIVDPRAPENLYNWHRQTDTYNGWFCEKVTVTFINETEVSDILVVTEKVSKKTDFTVSAKAGSKKAKITLQKIFPQKDEEFVLGEFAVKNGAVSKKFSLPVEPWSVDAPVLYAVRVIALDKSGRELDDEVIETGFRTIKQKDGRVLLNGEPIVLNGALIMQFLPPHEETAATHVCPRDEQIWQQEKLVRLLGGNTLRLHMLGYGSNDIRYARYADRIGLLLIWITRFIDSAEQMAFGGKWQAKDGYIKQISARRNHPSIIMWEGSNEYHPDLNDINNIYKTFVPAVKEVDKTRLICPVSHLYYAADLYPYKGCGYYDDSGKFDHDGNRVSAPREWCDPLVVRSSHTYEILLGYGTGWERMREQDWSIQPGMFNSKKHSYLITEFAVIGRPSPNVPDSKEHYFNDKSYEVGDEKAMGYPFTTENWRESQAYQALCAKVCTQVLRLNDADGMLWCCLMSGANNGSYLKPPIDCHGYPKYSFYTLREGYQQDIALSKSLDVLKPRAFEVTPVIAGLEKGEGYKLTAEVMDLEGNVVESKSFSGVCKTAKPFEVGSFDAEVKNDGYYTIKYTLDK